MDESEFRALHRLDDMDLEILRILQEDPRLPVSRVARKIGLTDNAARYRIRRMQANGVIRGFVMVTDPRLLGHTCLGLVLARLKDPLQLAALVEAHADVMGAYQCEGAFNACLLVCVPREAELRGFAQTLLRTGDVEKAEVLVVRDGFRAVPMPLLPEPLGMEEEVGAEAGAEAGAEKGGGGRRGRAAKPRE